MNNIDPVLLIIGGMLLIIIILFFKNSSKATQLDEINNIISANNQEIEDNKQSQLKVSNENSILQSRASKLTDLLKVKENAIIESELKLSETQKINRVLKEELHSLKEKVIHISDQLNNFRLSPHFLKNYLNKTFLESKLSFDKEHFTSSFSIFGRKYFSAKKIETQIKKQNQKFDETLNKLVDILNYLLYSSKVPMVHLQTEMIELKNFCRLIELNSPIKVEIKDHITSQNFYIPPTILFNYIDNAVKHGYYKKNNKLSISIEDIDNTLFYQVSNPVHTLQSQNKDIGGIGNKQMNRKANENRNCKIQSFNSIVDNNYIAHLQITL